MRALRDDINILNLMNGMNYSIHQLAHLARYARQAEEARKRAEGTFDKATASRYRDALCEIAAALERGTDPKPATLQTAGALRGRLHARSAGRDETQLAAQAREVLFESQREVLVDYEPCLVPPKNLKDPVRVGQAHDNVVAIRALEQIRAIPEAKWKTGCGEVVEKVLAFIESHEGAFRGEEREKKKKELADYLERARALSDVDFELQKAELAEEVYRFARKETLKKELGALLGRDAVIDAKIRGILLHPRAGALYEARLKQMKEAAVGKAVDLDKISPADHCKNGGCAIKDK